MILARALIVTALLVTASAGTGGAQGAPADSLPFRPGQWAAQFFVYSPQGFGALRFRSSSSAWLIDGSLQAEHRSVNGANRTQATTTVRGGLRSYRPVAPRIVRYVGGGLTGSYLGFRDEAPTGDGVYRGWNAGGGLYAEIGAEYLITAHLGLGASTSATAQLRGGKVDNFPGGTDYKEFGGAFSVGGLRVLATVYF